MIYNQTHVVQYICIDTFPRCYYPSHKYKKFPPFRIWNGHQTLSIYQLFLLSCVEIPPQGININLILTILSNIPPVLLPTILHYDILHLIQIQISLLRHLLLKHTRLCLLNTTQKIKQINMHTPFKHARLFNISISINSQKLLLLFFGKVLYWLIHINLPFKT